MAVIYRFGAYVFPAYGRADDEQLNEARAALSDLPVADGAWDHLGDASYKAAGQVSHRFALVGNNYEDLDDQVDEFLAAMNQGRQKLYWRMRDNSLRWAWAKKRSISMPTGGGRRLVLPVTVIFDVPEAIRYAPFGVGGITWGDFVWGEGALWGYGEQTLFGFGGTATDITMTNPGNAPALATITLSCAVGQHAQNVKVARRVSGADAQWFQTTRTIAATKSLVVNCAAYSVEYNGADDYDNFSIGADQVEWLHLEPGSNTIRITCANGDDAGSIQFDFYPPFH